MQVETVTFVQLATQFYIYCTSFYTQVTATSGSITRFSGKFQLQLTSMSFTCTFSMEKGKGATFDVSPDGTGPFTTDKPQPRIQGTTAHIDLNINGPQIHGC